jgi:hypothetical protein
MMELTPAHPGRGTILALLDAMGCEDFVVKLTPGVPSSEVLRVILSLPGISPPSAAASVVIPGAHYYRYEDPDHVIELELGALGGALSLRFALCHPPSIDRLFVDLVVTLATRTAASVAIFDDSPADLPELGWEHPAGDLSRLPDAIAHRIPRSRALWQASFGATPLRASCNEALAHFVLAGAAARFN